jgi:chromosome partitioning protein
MSVSNVIKKTKFENLDLISSNVDLSGLEIETAGDNDRAFILKTKLTAYLNDSGAFYDYILIDCAPSLGLITLNSLVAADSLIIPIQCEYFALEGLGKLLNTIKSVQKLHNKDLDIEGLLLTMYDTRLRLSNQVVEEVKKHFGKMVFKTIIQRNIKLSEAPSFGEDIISYDASSRGAKSYLSLGSEIIKRNK